MSKALINRSSAFTGISGAQGRHLQQFFDLIFEFGVERAKLFEDRSNANKLVNDRMVLDALPFGFSEEIEADIDAVREEQVKLGFKIRHTGRGGKLGFANLLQQRGSMATK